MRMKKKSFSQVYLEECKYKIKKNKNGSLHKSVGASLESEWESESELESCTELESKLELESDAE